MAEGFKFVLLSCWHLFNYAALVGIIAGAFAGFLQWWNNYVDVGFLDANINQGGQSYAAFATLCVFFVVFRLGQSYARYWEGVHLIHQMFGDWFDAVSSLCAFCRYSTESRAKILQFQHTVIRLVSLLNALICASLEGAKTFDRTQAFHFEVIDLDGLDEDTIDQIVDSEQRVELVFQKLQLLIVANMKTGILTIPPPILARSIEDLSNGILKYHTAEKLLVPFPRPYVLVQRALLLAFACLTPLWMVIWTRTILGAFCFTFLLVFAIHGLTAISEELDNPFDHRSLDFETNDVQKRLNSALYIMVAEGDNALVTLKEDIDLSPTTPLTKKTSFSAAMQKSKTSRSLSVKKNGSTGAAFPSEASAGSQDSRGQASPQPASPPMSAGSGIPREPGIPQGDPSRMPDNRPTSPQDTDFSSTEKTGLPGCVDLESQTPASAPPLSNPADRPQVQSDALGRPDAETRLRDVPGSTDNKKLC